MVPQEPRYVAIAKRKQAELAAAIPDEWRLPADKIPAGMLSPAESISEGPKQYKPVRVIDIPRRCGLLTDKELIITENYDVRGLVSAMTTAKYTAEEVVRAFSKRAAIAHQLTRCLTEPLFDRALKRAKELDDHLRRTGKPVGPLHGLPISVKDTFWIKGVDSSIGLAAYAFQPAPENAPLVDLLHGLGAVIIAKTNVPQTLGCLDSANHLFGRTLNPLNRKLTAGGSSGGEGALLAMRGSMVGIGTDIGGSIRIPAMCQGIYGFKPSHGHVPYGGQQEGQIPGKGRAGIQAVAGPLARSVADLGAVLAEIVPRADLFGEDCIPGPTAMSHRCRRSLRVLDEVAQILRHTPGVKVVEITPPPEFAQCHILASKLMAVDGTNKMLDAIEEFGEPLIPWLTSWYRRHEPMPIGKVAALQAERSKIEKAMLKMWTSGSSHERCIDAIICPQAGHPVPELDKYGLVDYTSCFVLLDYPSGNVPVRAFAESDLQPGEEFKDPVLSKYDAKNRLLWDEKSIDRRVYLDSPLSVQVVTPKQRDYELFRAMEIIDRAVQGQKLASHPRL
ncbi:hypothetical protein N7468_002057 [Penicillium chermesinum]|uniref:amidase n=1 Tax=Penicillium chermesinum TaxID=63820 RepID=A0A9W9TZ81_9EURO|nr:uncharacterized protein N7468_002057 [Penicillium chermesinum]KAJ5247074.1 hypothetical protein N7468_002057 [Penicillium chermesinum]